MVHVTRHAKKRLKERSGLQKGSMARISEKAFIQGINYRDTKGRLRKWIAKVDFDGGTKMTKLYGDKLYLFDDNRLVTILQVPADLARDRKKMICY